MQELKGAKMNWKNRLSNYNFWLSMFSAVLLILQALKIEFDVAYVNEIFTAVLGLLVVVGIIIDPTKSVKSEVKTEQKAEEKSTEKANKQEEIVKEQAEQLPIEEKSEVDNAHNENDIKVILEKIATEIEEKLNILQQKTTQIEKVDVSAPAAAEMENPFLDLMK